MWWLTLFSNSQTHFEHQLGSFCVELALPMTAWVFVMCSDLLPHFKTCMTGWLVTPKFTVEVNVSMYRYFSLWPVKSELLLSSSDSRGGLQCIIDLRKRKQKKAYLKYIHLQTVTALGLLILHPSISSSQKSLRVCGLTKGIKWYSWWFDWATALSPRTFSRGLLHLYKCVIVKIVIWLKKLQEWGGILKSSLNYAMVTPSTEAVSFSVAFCPLLY